MKMLITREWLLEKIKASPDEECVSAGVLHPDAPVPLAIQGLSAKSTDLDIIAVIEKVEGCEEPYRAIFRAALCEYAEIDEAVYDSLKMGVPR